MEIKKVKTLKYGVRNSLQNSVFTYLKFNFSKKLLISKLLVSFEILCERERYMDSFMLQFNSHVYVPIFPFY